MNVYSHHTYSRTVGQRKSIQTEKVNENVNIMISDIENPSNKKGGRGGGNKKNPKDSISHFLELMNKFISSRNNTEVT